MKDPMKKYFRTGLVHFMAYPFAMSGEGEITKTIRTTLEDPYFEYIELTKINDPKEREQAAKLAQEAGVGIAYGAQPQLLRSGDNLCDLNETGRMRAVARVKACVDEAYSMNAEGIAFLAGRYDAQRIEEHYQALVRSTREICAYAQSKGAMAVNLEVFDADVEKCSLIGPAPLARRFAAEISKEYPRFGLMADLSHIAQLRESYDENLDPILPYLRHVHLANAVLTKGQPAYGDQHPRFGIAYSEITAETVTAFLKKLFAVGYLGGENRPVISFEVKPLEGEDSAMIIAGAKRMLDVAWAQLEVE